MPIFRLPVLLVLFCGLLMYVLHLTGMIIPYALFYRVEISLGLLILGIAILITGGYSFKKASTTVNPVHPDKASHLVTSGIYRYSRNPQYIGFLLWVAAGAIYSGNLLSLLLLPVFVLIINIVFISREEQALESLFGDDFRQYKRQVRRWI